MSPTIYDIAKKAGVSITTVSKVLNNYPDISDKTRKKILRTIEEIGYHPNSHARALMTKKYWTIGVVFIEALGVGIKHPFFSAVIESFRKKVGELGYDLLLLSPHAENGRKNYLDRLLSRGVDGIIVVSPQQFSKEIEELIDHDIPSVFIDINSKNVSVVSSDNYYGSQLVIDYLYSLGHRKIAHIAGASETFAGSERLKGFLDAVKKYSLEIPKSYIVDGGYFDVTGGEIAMNKLLALPERPTAVYVAGDMMALGAIQSIKKHGLSIPKNISVVGFDDIQLASLSDPKLTTIRQNTELIGMQAANILVEQINRKKKIPMNITVPVELVKRESVCSPNMSE
ncbi:LacI family DNA-binding transcriptional regulator [Anoxybacillus ayderensis]|uniref:LacI family DNA-binding transcriptional regulator n=1 Tax=Anoxybacillus ayderensis TaxID=265546 RepID=UPI000A26CD40|nr:LacI family DNA-binding transcriptional regulator [Anoxybacillus ayderensis]MED0686430.1 LacI family DNA-binding transcriptional regulator [Anoxybacillus ayderensis]OSX53218.1 LacI family transcriptional regulator [Anoxybacillus ayderensis]